MKLKIKKIHPDARLPIYATAGSACFDLHAIETAHDESRFGYLFMPTVFRTGLAVEVPEGHTMLIFSRSSQGFKDDVRLANCVGVIDSDYRGEIKVKLTPDMPNEIRVYDGDRIAQAMIIPIEQVQFELVDELSSTTRGANGFGSTGK